MLFNSAFSLTSLNRTFLLGLLLSGTILGLGGCNPGPQGVPSDAPESQPQPNPVNYPGRDGLTWSLAENCAAAGDTSGAVYGDLLYNDPAQTGALVEFTRKAAVYTCAYDNAPSLSGIYDPATGIAAVSSPNAEDRGVQNLQALIAAYNDNRGLSKPDEAESLYGRVLHAVSAGAVATVGSYALAIETRESGTGSLAARLEETRPTGWDVFAATYARLRAEGRDLRAGLEQASAATIEALLRDADFIRAQSDDAVDDYYAGLKGAKPKFVGRDYASAALPALGHLPGGLNLARGVTLPGRAELAAADPETAALIEGAEKGTLPYSQIDTWRAAGGNRYSVRQAFLRARTEKPISFRQRARDLSAFYTSCAEADDNPRRTPGAAADLWRNMQLVRGTGRMGAEIYDFARRNDILICFFTMDADTAGEWYPGEATLRISAARNGAIPEAAIQVHEVIHGVQEKNGLLAADPRWNIYDYQMSNLSYEAAARAGEIVFAIARREEAGDNSLIEAMQPYGPPLQAALEAYRQARDRGAPVNGALQYAGSAAWTGLMQSPWSDFYNQLILKQYIGLATQAGTPTSGAYKLETAQLTGKISDSFNFTSAVQNLPDPASLFTGNPRMRQAFDYVNLWQALKTLGPASAPYLREKQRLEAQQNPFLGVDLSRVAQDMRDPKSQLKPLDAMNCYASTSYKCDWGNGANAETYRIRLPDGQQRTPRALS